MDKQERVVMQEIECSISMVVEGKNPAQTLVCFLVPTIAHFILLFASCAPSISGFPPDCW